MLNMETRKLKEQSCNEFNEPVAHGVFGDLLKGLDLK